MPSPEEQAREEIDRLLSQAGWIVQDKSAVNLSASRGVAVRELTFKTGEPDYTLFVDGKAIGTVEAKPAGHSLTGVEEQSEKYVKGVPFGIPAWRSPLPFSCESTGTETRFTSRLDPVPRSRNVFAFHRPETLLNWLENDGHPQAIETIAEYANRKGNFLTRIQHMPPLIDDLWPPKPQAIMNLEQSLRDNRPRALVQMATGSGKTLLAIVLSYRLIKFAGAKRILFLVDRGNLGKQTLKEFQQYVSPYNNYKFHEEYIIQRLTSNTLDTSARVCIATIQRLYSMLKGEELAEEDEERSVQGLEQLFKQAPTVEYNPAIPIEAFDIIITDECHRSIYNLWRQVLEYFDAHLIGLTATPSKQTFGFFNQNLVMEYNHERAVADGVNVNYDVYRIQTEITSKGATIDAGFYVDKRDRRTRKRRWEQLDEDFQYDPNQLDRDVVAEDQIRTVLQIFRDKLFTEIFPGRDQVPKTLIFAKDDTHADDIVRICREVFDKGNDFCQKITYRTGFVRDVEKKIGPDGQEVEEVVWKKVSNLSPDQILQAFRNSYNPRIAVTVDMIATGTDVKPLEIVFFMRSVKSRGFFEQMKGRGVRVISETEMEQVNPGIKRKNRFVVIDAVGVCEQDLTDSRPLEKKRTVTFDKLLDAIALGNREPEVLESLAGRLVRLEKRFDEALAAEVRTAAKGQTLCEIAQTLLQAVNPDKVEEASRLLALEQQRRDAAATLNYFDPNEPVAFLSGDLPHWRQDGATYFVTFRLADSLPQEKLSEWTKERDQWLGQHPEPHDASTRNEYYERFPQRLQQWLDAGAGSCVLALPEVKQLVENALRHFDGERYRVDEFVVASNHVHVLVSPLGEHQLSEILHSWKSFTAHEILKVEAASRRLTAGQNRRRDASATASATLKPVAEQSGGGVPPPPESGITVWQRESFDHIVRSPASMEKFREYIRAHRRADDTTYLELTDKQRRDAAATLAHEAVKPLAGNPPLRQLLIKIHQASEQVIDVITRDRVLFAGASEQTTQNAEQTAKSFRDYIEKHKAEITALQLLYSRPYRHRLTEPMLKELEKKLREEHAAWTEDPKPAASPTSSPSSASPSSASRHFSRLRRRSISASSSGPNEIFPRISFSTPNSALGSN
jgi:type I restriction enzyme R subunit